MQEQNASLQADLDLANETIEELQQAREALIRLAGRSSNERDASQGERPEAFAQRDEARVGMEKALEAHRQATEELTRRDAELEMIAEPLDGFQITQRPAVCLEQVDEPVTFEVVDTRNPPFGTSFEWRLDECNEDVRILSYRQCRRFSFRAIAPNELRSRSYLPEHRVSTVPGSHRTVTC